MIIFSSIYILLGGILSISSLGLIIIKNTINYGDVFQEKMEENDI